MSATASDRLPSALRFGDAALGLLALWTVCANTAVLLGLGLDALIGLFALAAVATAFALRRLPASLPAISTPRGGIEPRLSEARFRSIALVATAAALGLLHWTGDLRPFWLIAVALLIASSWRAARSSSNSSSSATAIVNFNGEAHATESAGAARWLWTAAAAGALLASVLQRPDADDALYLNLAISAVTRPELALLAADSLHGIEGLPLTLPVYRLHSIELLWAAVARVCGLRVLDVAHIITPALAGGLLPLALARLLRLLLPREWGWALTAALAFLLLGGGAVHAFGSFGFVRLQQGKAIALSVALPSIAAYAIEFARAPGASRWLRLAAAQVAALGLSASAVWLAPAVAGLALLSAAPVARSSLRRTLLGALGSAYPLAAGLAIRSSTRALFAEGSQRGEFPLLSDAALASSAIEPVLGGEPLASLLLATVLLAGVLAPTVAARRFGSVFALGFLLVFWNPFAANWIASSVSGPGTYWRVFWLLPLPVLIGALACAPRIARPLPLGLPAAAPGLLLCLLLLLWLPRSPVVSAAGGVAWASPGWRIPPRERPALDAVLEYSEAGSPVLLPLELAPWITGFEAAPTALVVRADYLGVLRARHDTGELDRRMHLARLVSGEIESPRAGDVLRKAIDDYSLHTIGLAGSARSATVLDAVLGEAGFERVFSDASYTLWTRAQAASSPRSGRSPQSPPASGQSPPASGQSK